MNKRQSDVAQMTEKIRKFCDDRNWDQFHNLKDLSLSLMLESAELMEHFQWKNSAEIENHLKKNKKAVGEELADVLYWTLRISDKIDLDLVKAFNAKMLKNAKKYPINKVKGKHPKYSKLK